MSGDSGEKKCWVFQAGKRGILFDEFRNEGSVSAFVHSDGWKETGDLSKIAGPVTQQKLRDLLERCYPNASGASSGHVARVLREFIDTVSIGDRAVVYGALSREFLLGKIVGEYEFVDDSDNPHRRKVEWKPPVPRDDLPHGARIATLGTGLALVDERIARELFRIADASSKAKGGVPSEVFDGGALSDDSQSREESAREAVKDRIVGLSPEHMEHLAAAVLRAMGYKTKVALPGPDGGIDVVASSDHFGLEKPRILTQVKHRKPKMGVAEIRAFMGVLNNDRGLYISVSGFSDEARREVRSSDKQLALIDLDDFADLVIEHYDNFDPEGRALLPLVKMYWPM